MRKFGIARAATGLLAMLMVSCAVDHSVDHGALNSALVAAASANDFKQVQNVLKKGADVNAKNAFGHTALMEASQNGHGQIVELLKAHGAKE